MLGSKIKELRKKHHISQESLADRIGVSRATLSRWERNEAVPDSDQLTRIADALQVDIRFLLSNDKSVSDISKDDKGIGNEELVEQLIRINDHLAEELVRRRENVRRIALIVLISLFVISMIFVILILTNTYVPGHHITNDGISISYSYDGEE
ncbi:Transcriptional regulator, contains XRE-family HTH domain [Ruminococcaceae bacterium YRB3002]|nr:Transcriptional regulator, contains XRE-family HTH domain [Ruminococcaceae bacterium YRB3002]